MEMKYVIIQRGKFEVPILFPCTESHKGIAEAITPTEDRVISAGFCNYGKDNSWNCYGESTSIGKKSRGIVDIEILNLMLGRGM